MGMQCVATSINDLLRISPYPTRITLEVLRKETTCGTETHRDIAYTEGAANSSLAQADPALLSCVFGLCVGATMQIHIGERPLRSLGLAMLLLLTACSGTSNAQGYRYDFRTEAIAGVAPGMNQTELQSVLGPPDYIQVKGLRQAWQYCPPRSFMRFIDDVFRVDQILRRESEQPLFVTVWFNSGRVDHMRAYPTRVMGSCNDFLAAFSWEDTIDGMYRADSAYGMK
jgi:hypothetical protein